MFAATEHLILRAYRESDGDRLLELEGDPRVARTAHLDYVLPLGPKWAKDLEERMKGVLMYLIIEVKPQKVDEGAAGGDSEGSPSTKPTKKEAEDEVWVGECVLSPSSKMNRDVHVGIALQPRWWGKGFGAEVLQWVVDYAFHQLNMHRVSLMSLESNERGNRLYKKIGFVEEGRRRSAFWQDGKWIDGIDMGILEDEWRALKSNRP